MLHFSEITLKTLTIIAVFVTIQVYRILKLYIHVTVHRNRFFFSNNPPDALIIQIYSVIKLYMFRASSLPIIRSSPLYIRHW